MIADLGIITDTFAFHQFFELLFEEQLNLLYKSAICPYWNSTT